MIEEIKPFEKRKEELIKMGLESGFVTYEQLATALKGLELDNDSLDELYNSLMENNIQVVTDEDLAGGTDEEDDGGSIEDAYNSTVSCYTPIDGKPCMSCTSCMSKFAAFYNNGYQFDDESIKRFMNYVENNYEVQKPDVIKIYEGLKSSRG